MSLLKLSKNVKFPQNNNVGLIFVLATTDSNKHLELISELTNLLMDDESMEKLFLAKSKKEVLQCIC
jgi:mannitol/fructose-specific phosphotransferase system IIA component (Ntr-type)